MPQPVVNCERVNGVATITLDSPANRNALSVALRTDLEHCLRVATEDRDVRLIVLTGSGPIFCAGADLREGRREGPGIPTLASILGVMMTTAKPILVVCNGGARAGGLGLVAAADIAIAPVEATFAFPEVRIGLVPAVISVPCLARMNPRAAARYFLTGEVFDATRAAEVGLLTEAVPLSHLGARRDAIVGDLLDAAPGALAGAKELLWAFTGLSLDAALARTDEMSERYFSSAEAAEGMLAFAEKRPPAWASGRSGASGRSPLPST